VRHKQYEKMEVLKQSFQFIYNNTNNLKLVIILYIMKKRAVVLNNQKREFIPVKEEEV